AAGRNNGRGRTDPGRNIRSLSPAAKERSEGAWISGLAVLHLRVADARILRWAGLNVALLDSDLVIRITLFFNRLLARIGLFHGRFLLRVRGDPVDLGVGLGL